MRLARLVIVGGLEKGREFSVSAARMSIGRAEDNELVLPDAEEHHCRIELRVRGYCLIDLGTPSGTTVNGMRVRETVLRSGDRVGIGSATFFFEELTAEVPVVRPMVQPARRFDGDVFVPGAVTCQSCGAQFSRDRVFCPNCGLRAGGDAVVPAEAYIPPVEHGPGARGAGIFPLLSLVFGILGPFFLLVGWLLAIILGLNSLALIRRRGGLARDRKFALWAIALGFMWPAVATPLTVTLWQKNRTALRISMNETEAIKSLKGLALTEMFAKSMFFVDRNQNGVSEYAKLDELEKLGERYGFGYFNRELVHGQRGGYIFNVHEATEDRFLMTATPATYGLTGRRTFCVSDELLLRGDDVGGRDVSEAPTRLAKLYQAEGGNLRAEFGDEIARNLNRAARQEASDGNFGRSQRILDELRDRYPLAPAASEKQIAEAIKEIEGLKAEEEAKQQFMAAGKLAETGKEGEALEKLKAIASLYASTKVISQVKAEIAKLEGVIQAQLERSAGERFAEAETVEVSGELEKAIELYRRLVAEFPTTEVAKKVAEVVKRAEAKRAEQAATGHVEVVKKVSPQEEPDALISRVEILRKEYAGTAAVTGSETVLARKEAESHAVLATRAATDGQLESAVSHYEKAVSLAPDMGGELKKGFESACLALAEACFKRKDYTGTVKNYDKYKSLNAETNIPPPDRYQEACYELGMQAAASGNVPEAKEMLARSAGWGGKRAEYHYLNGILAAREKKYTEAIVAFSQALERDEDHWKARAKRGLCRMVTVVAKENELKAALGVQAPRENGAREVLGEASAILAAMEETRVQLRLDSDRRLRKDEKEFQMEQRVQMVPVAKARKLKEYREKVEAIRKVVDQDAAMRTRVLQTLRSLKLELGEAADDIVAAARAAEAREVLGDAGKAARQKYALFGRGAVEVEESLNQAKFLQSEAMKGAERGLQMLDAGSKLDSAVRSVENVYRSISLAASRGGVSEGVKLLTDSSSIKIDFEALLGKTD